MKRQDMCWWACGLRQPRIHNQPPVVGADQHLLGGPLRRWTNNPRLHSKAFADGLVGVVHEVVPENYKFPLCDGYVDAAILNIVFEVEPDVPALVLDEVYHAQMSRPSESSEGRHISAPIFGIIHFHQRRGRYEILLRLVLVRHPEERLRPAVDAHTKVLCDRCQQAGSLRNITFQATKGTIHE